MAGAGLVPSGNGSRRPLDASINLVPFIDLLSCCISFLLLTAVWIDLGRLDVAPSATPAADRDPPPDPTLARVTLRVDEGGYLLHRSTGESLQLPRQHGQLDHVGLGRALSAVRSALPQQHELHLQAGDGIRYAELIAAMDLARGAAFENIDVRPSAP